MRSRRAMWEEQGAMTDKLEDDAGDRVTRHVGARIRRRRREIGVSQSRLAGILGLSFQQVQKYESGANRVSSPLLWRISQVLGTSTDYWFDGLPTGPADRLRYDQTTQLLLTEDGQDLAQAFARIPRRSARLALIALAQELAGGQCRQVAANTSEPADESDGEAPRRPGRRGA